MASSFRFYCSKSVMDIPTVPGILTRMSREGDNHQGCCNFQQPPSRSDKSCKSLIKLTFYLRPPAQKIGRELFIELWLAGYIRCLEVPLGSHQVVSRPMP